MQVHGALLALHTGRAVRIVYGRAESFVGHVHRHPARMRFEHRAARDGRLTCVRCEILLDGGAYASSSAAVVSNACAFAPGPYAVPNALIEGTVVYTNNPPCGAMRGFGAVQTCFGSEAQMDLLAAELGMDPVELRAAQRDRSGRRPADGPAHHGIAAGCRGHQAGSRAAGARGRADSARSAPVARGHGRHDARRGRPARRGLRRRLQEHLLLRGLRRLLRGPRGAAGRRQRSRALRCGRGRPGRRIRATAGGPEPSSRPTTSRSRPPRPPPSALRARPPPRARPGWPRPPCATPAVPHSPSAACAARSGDVDVERIHRHPRTWPLDPESGQVLGRALPRRVRRLRDARRGRGRRGSRPCPRRLDRRGPGRRARAQPAGRDRPDRGRHRTGPRPRADGGDPDARRAHRQPDVHRLPPADGARHAAARHRADRGSRARSAVRREGRGRAADSRLDRRHRGGAPRRQRASRSRACPCGPTTSRWADGRAHLLRRARRRLRRAARRLAGVGAPRRARCWTRSSAASSATRHSACSTAPAASARRPSASRCAVTTCSRPTSRPRRSSAPRARRRRWARRSRPASPTSRACHEQVEGAFACVLACDNSVAHLHADEDLARFAAGVRGEARAGRPRDRQPARLRAARGRARAGPSACASGRDTISFQVWEWDDDGRTYELAQFTLRGAGEQLGDGLPPHAPARAAARRAVRTRSPAAGLAARCAGARPRRRATTSRS